MSGKFSITQQTLAAQAQKAIFCLYKYTRKFRNLDIGIQLELFDKLITPILTYGCEVWGFHSADATEKVQTSFCKKLLGLKWNTENSIVLGELGRYTLKSVWYVRIIKYWLKVINCEQK